MVQCCQTTASSNGSRRQPAIKSESAQSRISADWICKKGQKIEHKAACLRKRGTGFGWPFSHINFNPIADYFIFSAWDNRYNLMPMHIWIFYREDIVREDKFWRRQNLWISNNIKGLEEFENYEVTHKLEKLKKIRNMRTEGD